jgi:hypothetical protein
MIEHLEPPPSALPLLDASKAYFPELWEDHANAVATEKTIVRPRHPSYINEYALDYRKNLETYKHKSRSLPSPDAANRIFAEIQQEMKGKLQAGEVIAWARKNSPVDPWFKVPASSWQYLKIFLGSSTAKNANVQLFNIHVSNVEAHLSASAERETAGTETLDPVPHEEPTANLREPPRPKNRKAGRPTSKAIILAELARRIEECSLEETLSKQADALLDWFGLNYPDDLKKRAMRSKTIENYAGPMFKAGKLKCTNKFKG